MYVQKAGNATSKDHAAVRTPGRSPPARRPDNPLWFAIATRTQPASSAVASVPSQRGNDSRRFAVASPSPVQARSTGPALGLKDPAQVRRDAAQGFGGSGQALPHLGPIQASFGGHDLSGVKAHVGGPSAGAAEAIGAEAYAMGEKVAFGTAPDLHTAAHEAAHVVQQRAGLQLPGGVGRAGDAYERQADDVAEKVVRGESAAGLLGAAGLPRHAPVAPVQRFESDEHKAIGDDATRGKGGQPATIELAPGYIVTYGDVLAMAGDFFGSMKELKDLAAIPGPGAGTREEVEYVRVVKVREQKSRENDFSQAARTAADKRYYSLAQNNRSHFPNARAIDLLIPKAVRDKERDDRGQPGNAGGSYAENHGNAIREAVRLGKAGEPIDGALALEAFSGHFLTDSFSGGHLRTARADITPYWNNKVPLFFLNFKWYMAEQIARNIKSDGSFMGWAASLMTVDYLFEESLKTLETTLAEKGMPAVGFGDMVSSAVHDYDNKHGVTALVSGRAETLYGDSQIPVPGKETDPETGKPKPGGRTKALAIRAVKASLKDIYRAYEAGKKGKSAETVVALMMDREGLFIGERMMPTAIPDSDPRQLSKSTKWDFDTVDQLLNDDRMKEAMTITAMDKAATLAKVGQGLDAKFKRDAFARGVIRPLRANPLGFLTTVINYAPNTGGGIGGHNVDDKAMDYLAEARKTQGGVESLRVEQKKRLVPDLNSGVWTSGSEEKGILDILGGGSVKDAVAAIRAAGWRKLYKGIDGDNCRAFVERFGPAYFAQAGFAEKEAEVKYLADGRTNDLAQETIIIILRTCTPAQVAKIDADVGGWTGLSFDLDGKWNAEFKRMLKGQ